jgi:hypothetical protein
MSTTPSSDDTPLPSEEEPQPSPVPEEDPAQPFTPRYYGPEEPIKPSKGFIKIANTIVDRMPDMGPDAWAVYCQLVRHADRKGHCWPSIHRMAELAPMDEKTVRKALKTLATMKLIAMQKTDGKVTQYWVQH